MLALGWTWFLPLFLVLSGVVWAAGGMAVLPDAAFAALAMLTVAGQTTRIIGTRVPFTERASRSAAEGNLGLMIMLSFVVGMCVGLHAVLRSWLPAYLTAIAVLVVVAYATLRSLGRIQLGRGGWVRRA